MLSCLSDPPILSVTHADCIEVSMAVEPFRSMYLQTCLQALVEVWARAGLKPMTIRATRRKHGAVNHSATPAWLSSDVFRPTCIIFLTVFFLFPDCDFNGVLNTRRNFCHTNFSRCFNRFVYFFIQLILIRMVFLFSFPLSISLSTPKKNKIFFG